MCDGRLSFFSVHLKLYIVSDVISRQLIQSAVVMTEDELMLRCELILCAAGWRPLSRKWRS